MTTKPDSEQVTLPSINELFPGKQASQVLTCPKSTCLPTILHCQSIFWKMYLQEILLEYARLEVHNSVKNPCPILRYVTIIVRALATTKRVAVPNIDLS